MCRLLPAFTLAELRLLIRHDSPRQESLAATQRSPSQCPCSREPSARERYPLARQRARTVKVHALTLSLVILQLGHIRYRYLRLLCDFEDRGDCPLDNRSHPSDFLRRWHPKH